MMLLPSISKHLEKFAILTDQIIHTLKMSLYASVCNNTVAMWPLFIELIVSFCKKITGKISVTQGKLRENTGNFILARMWPPCTYFRVYFGSSRLLIKVVNVYFFHSEKEKSCSIGTDKYSEEAEEVIGKQHSVNTISVLFRYVNNNVHK